MSIPHELVEQVWLRLPANVREELEQANAKGVIRKVIAEAIEVGRRYQSDIDTGRLVRDALEDTP